MSYLSIYFLVKTGLYYTNYIGFHWALNLLFAVALSWPIPGGALLRVRRYLTWPLALMLLYHDSFLPTPTRVLSQMGALSGFSPAYMLELLARVYNPLALIGLLGILVVYLVLASRIRFTTLAFASILSVPLMAQINTSSYMVTAIRSADKKQDNSLESGLTPPSTAVDPQSELMAFYTKENQRHLSFSTGGKTPAFDIILLHVCSLSWDDMDFVNERNHPLLKRFDLVFTNFNSAASYSGPASIRVLRGTCGQSPHDKLYKAVDPQCYVFPNLETIGYQAHGLLNHDGIYEKFANTLELRTGLKGKMDNNQGAPVALQNFDGSPIFDDYALLSKWWNDRQSRGAQPEALYYNSVSLHDGNRVPGQGTRSSMETYKPRLVKLMTDLDKFLTQLEKSGKPVVVMLIPEHGASMRGDKIQISGMREIPSPGITLVPAAIKLIGLNQPASTPKIITEPISFFGIYSLLADLLADNPFLPDARPLTARLDKIEKTSFVSENGDVVVMRTATGKFMMKSDGGDWVPYLTK